MEGKETGKGKKERRQAGRMTSLLSHACVLSSFVRVRLFSATTCLKPITCHLFGHVTPVFLLHKFISVFCYILVSFTVIKYDFMTFAV